MCSSASVVCFLSLRCVLRGRVLRAPDFPFRALCLRVALCGERALPVFPSARCVPVVSSAGAVCGFVRLTFLLVRRVSAEPFAGICARLSLPCSLFPRCVLRGWVQWAPDFPFRAPCLRGALCGYMRPTFPSVRSVAAVRAPRPCPVGARLSLPCATSPRWPLRSSAGGICASENVMCPGFLLRRCLVCRVYPARCLKISEPGVGV